MDLYKQLINTTWYQLKKLKPLLLYQICRYEENYKMFLLIYYGHYDYIVKNYNHNILLSKNAFLAAILKGRLKIIKYFAKLYKININYVDNLNHSAYMIAAAYGKIKTMKYLESLKINIHHKGNDKENAYYMAIFCGKINVIKYLESRGYNIYNKIICENNVYIYALFNKKYQLLRHLESKETHLYLKKNIRTFYQYFDNRAKKFCRYKFNISRFPYFLFILFIFGFGVL